MAKIFVKSYGCAANQDNASIIKGLLAKERHRLVDSERKADLIVVNTCIVKGATESKVRSYIKKWHGKKMIVISGCMPGAEEGICERMWPDAALVSTQHITDIAEVVNEMLKNNVLRLTGKRRESKLGLEKMAGRFGIVQISEGCAGSCSYCIVKLAKGELHSFPARDIVREVKRFIDAGINKIYLTSQDNGAYGIDRGKPELVELLRKILKIKKNFKLRIGMMNPEHTLKMADKLVEIYKDQRIMKLIHIPVQSGSDRVLMEMERKYNAGDFEIIVERFRAEIPGICVATDIICGYPTESEEDFKKSLELIKKVSPEVLNISKFASRPGTRASKLRQLKSEVIKERSVRMSRLLKQQRAARKSYSCSI